MIDVVSVTLSTNAAGAGSATTGIITGMLHAIRYEKVDFDDDSTIAITGATTGTAMTYDGTRVLGERYELMNEGLTIAITAGGDTKSGKYHFYVER